jgi:hypothetical protein
MDSFQWVDSSCRYGNAVRSARNPPRGQGVDPFGQSVENQVVGFVSCLNDVLYVPSHLCSVIQSDALQREIETLLHIQIPRPDPVVHHVPILFLHVEVLAGCTCGVSVPPETGASASPLSMPDSEHPAASILIKRNRDVALDKRFINCLHFDAVFSDCRCPGRVGPHG